MSSLYQLTGEAAWLQAMLEDGEIDEQVYADTLESMQITEKVENICKIIRNLEGRAKMFKEEKDRLAAKQKVAENGIERLKGSLLNYMQTMANKKLEAGLFTVTKCSTQSVDILSEDMIPDEYRVPQPAKISVSDIGKALRDGADVPGARLAKSEYLRIK